MSEFHNKELNEAVTEFKEIHAFESSVNFPLVPLLFFILLPFILGSYVDMTKWLGVYVIAIIISTISSLGLIWKYMNDKSKEYANDLKQRKANSKNSRESR